MNLVLIGYRGTGKSVISRIISQHMDLPVFHMDDELQKRFGSSIPDYVEANGWDAFRDAEETLAIEAAGFKNTILDTGGGVVERETNCTVLRESGFVVWLQSSVESIASRISGDSNRPSLSKDKSAADEVRDILERRTPLYDEMSHTAIHTDKQSLQQSARQIIEKYLDAKSHGI